MKALGEHWIIEFYSCQNQEALKNRKICERIFIEAAKTGGFSTIGSFFHQFKPHGVSGVVVIEESHLSIHTWPEHGYAAIDIFFCSENTNPHKTLEFLKSAFQPQKVHIQIHFRGLKHYLNS